MLIYLIPLTLALLLFISVGYLVMRRPELCPGCGKRAMRCLEIVATKTGPKEHVSDGYLECAACSARWTQRNGGEFEKASDKAWAAMTARRSVPEKGDPVSTP